MGENNFSDIGGRNLKVALHRCHSEFMSTHASLPPPPTMTFKPHLKMLVNIRYPDEELHEK